MFSVSITHNSKIRKLSDGNRIMKTELSYAKRILSYESNHFWVMSYENWKLSYENRPLDFFYGSLSTVISLSLDFCLFKQKPFFLFYAVTIWNTIIYILNNHFQFLNNIIYIFKHFFTYTYFQQNINNIIRTTLPNAL